MAQKTEGSIVSWKEDKGFGFIKVASGEDIFFHISEYNKRHQGLIEHKPDDLRYDLALFIPIILNSTQRR